MFRVAIPLGDHFLDFSLVFPSDSTLLFWKLLLVYWRTRRNDRKFWSELVTIADAGERMLEWFPREKPACSSGLNITHITYVDWMSIQLRFALIRDHYHVIGLALMNSAHVLVIITFAVNIDPYFPIGIHSRFDRIVAAHVETTCYAKELSPEIAREMKNYQVRSFFIQLGVKKRKRSSKRFVHFRLMTVCLFVNWLGSRCSVIKCMTVLLTAIVCNKFLPFCVPVFFVRLIPSKRSCLILVYMDLRRSFHKSIVNPRKLTFHLT